MNHRDHAVRRHPVRTRRGISSRNGRTAIALDRFVDAIAQAVGAQLAAAATGDQSGLGSAVAHRRPAGGVVADLERVRRVRRSVARAGRDVGAQQRKSEAAAFSPSALPRTAVVIVATNDVVRRGLVAIFEERPDFLVTGAAATAQEAARAIARFRPDVVLLSPGRPDADEEIVRRILETRPACRILVAGSDDQWAVLAAVLDPESAAFVAAGPSAEELVAAVRGAVSGLPPSVAQDRRRPEDRPGAFPLLAHHQAKLLPLLAQGKTNREIASALGLSEHTVKTYVSQILRRLNLKRRAEAAALITRQSTRITA